jgi:putative transcriptional regulator
VRDFESSSLSLAGSLLSAHPGLLDPNFRRSVLFLSTNDPNEGSFGMILNRPAGRTVGDVLSNKSLGPLDHVPVLLGGPVQQDQLVFAGFRWVEEEGRMECRHHLMIPEAQELVSDEETIVRAFIGYAGWGKGQLEGELAAKAWLISKVARDVLSPEKSPRLWRDLTSQFGPWFKLVAEAPEDPSGN